MRILLDHERFDEVAAIYLRDEHLCVSASWR